MTLCHLEYTHAASSLGTLSPILSKIIKHRIMDTDVQLSSTLHNLWERFSSHLEQKMNAFIVSFFEPFN